MKRREEIEHDRTPEGESEVNKARSRGDLVKCIAVRCATSKTIHGFVVPCKGADEEDIVAEMVVQVVAWLGHTRVIVKADGEPAIQSLVRRVLELAKVECRDL